MTTSIWGELMRVVGVDEAGRGPCIGPLFVGALAIPEMDLHHLDELGVTDSKRLRPAQRESLDAEPDVARHNEAGAWPSIRSCPPTSMWQSKSKASTASKRKGFVEAIRTLWLDGEGHHLVLDACDVDAARFGRNVVAACRAPPDAGERGVKAPCGCRPPGGRCASIVAKVARDAWVRDFIDRTGIDIGSGYLSDPKMKQALPELLREDQPHCLALVVGHHHTGLGDDA